MSLINTNCAGVARRDFLQLGLGAIGGVTFTDILRMRAEAAQARGKASPDHINCILVWLDGGPSHYESFDPKPDAPKDPKIIDGQSTQNVGSTEGRKVG